MADYRKRSLELARERQERVDRRIVRLRKKLADECYAWAMADNAEKLREHWLALREFDRRTQIRRVK